MGHSIFGIIGPSGLVAEYAAAHELHRPTPLQKNDLVFLPLSDEHLDDLFPDPCVHDDEMIYLCSGIKDTLSELSQKGTVAWIETTYVGGFGEQSATVYQNGYCIMKPTVAFRGPISSALQLMGVTKAAEDIDEFAAVGLCEHRENDDWIAAANGADFWNALLPTSLSGHPLIDTSDELQEEQELQRANPGSFSFGACLIGSALNLLGCLFMAGVHIVDGMITFAETGGTTVPAGSLLTWLWSPVAMAAFTFFDTPPNPASPEFALVSAISFGVFVGFFVARIKRPNFA
ncbi:hypothetical protein [Verrucomicrobium sp. BvORR034]|uniref:hypothetical protein n=1 Tax=Verrucomicrobium sp. BvORR034 TaxID=1396418 RepID=UPI000679E97B|nr:hypothetical protein [Verrucomicrobium sp. BvORR034]